MKAPFIEKFNNQASIALHYAHLRLNSSSILKPFRQELAGVLSSD
jgi:hypothetical protein